MRMRSESTSALGQPRLTNPTLGWFMAGLGAGGGRVFYRSVQMPRSNRVREVLQPVPGALLLVAAWFCLAAGATALRAAPPDRLAEALARQQALVAAWPAGERVAGYKSAFNSPQMQQRFGLDRPAFAVLPASAERCAGLSAGCAVSREGYRRMVLEIEVALRLGAAITQPLADEAALVAHIDGVMLSLIHISEPTRPY